MGGGMMGGVGRGPWGHRHLASLKQVCSTRERCLKIPDTALSLRYTGGSTSHIPSVARKRERENPA